MVLGDAGRVRAQLARDPGLATRTDPGSGWTALHLACASRWHRLDPDRADGLLAVARLLLDAGAQPSEVTAGARTDSGRPGQPGGWTPLRCAVAGAANPPITQLLLERGAVPTDHDLHLAGFGGDHHQCLRLLLSHAGNVADLARMALSAPISVNDTEGVRLLLEAGADPGRYVADDPPPAPAVPVVYAAVQAGCAPELVGLLLAHGGEPDAPGPDGRSPYALATSLGRLEMAALLRSHGATDDTTDIDRFLAACLRADRAGADQQLTLHPGLPGRLTGAQQGRALSLAARTGHIAALQLILDIGFWIDARDDEDGGTALHAAAYAGSTRAVRLLLGHGADIESRDTHWDSPPLDWAIVGSGYQPQDDPHADWVATVQALIEAGASTADITLSPDDPKPPSPQVARWLREHGIPPAHPQSER